MPNLFVFRSDIVVDPGCQLRAMISVLCHAVLQTSQAANKSFTHGRVGLPMIDGFLVVGKVPDKLRLQ